MRHTSRHYTHAFFCVAALCTFSSYANETSYNTVVINGTVRNLPVVKLSVPPAHEIPAFTINMHAPLSADISAHMQPIADQGQLGTCATFASVAAIEKYAKQQLSQGCILRLRGGFDGDLPERVTNDIAKYGLTTPKKHNISSGSVDCAYSDKQTSTDLKENQYKELVSRSNILANGLGFSFANSNDTAIYDNDHEIIDAVLGDNGASFEYIKTQIDLGNPVVLGVAVPDSNDPNKSFMGGNGAHLIDVTPSDSCGGRKVKAGQKLTQVYCSSHAIVIVGYDENQKEFKFRNSWGTGWGYKGYGRLSYNFLKTYRWGPTTVVTNQ